MEMLDSHSKAKFAVVIYIDEPNPCFQVFETEEQARAVAEQHALAGTASTVVRAVCDYYPRRAFVSKDYK